jgi:hypothetical protein
VSDIDTVLVDSPKALDPKRPIREADIGRLGPVEIHREFITAAARWMIAAKL